MILNIFKFLFIVHFVLLLCSNNTLYEINLFQYLETILFICVLSIFCNLIFIFVYFLFFSLLYTSFSWLFPLLHQKHFIFLIIYIHFLTNLKLARGRYLHSVNRENIPNLVYITDGNYNSVKREQPLKFSTLLLRCSNSMIRDYNKYIDYIIQNCIDKKINNHLLYPDHTRFRVYFYIK